MKDIFRKYPSRYEGIIPTLFASLDDLDEPEAKAALIWIIGEYAAKVDNAGELLSIFVKTFGEEGIPVQLQTLTAVVKLYLQKPEAAQTLVQTVLNAATKEVDSPDVRDRAYIYWRLLSTDPGAAKAVVLAHRPPISLPQTTVPQMVLEELLGDIGSLASVYHKPAQTFLGTGRVGTESLQRTAGLVQDVSTQKALRTVVEGQRSENLLDFDADEPTADGGSGGLGIAATDALGQPGVQNILTSSNPLDDLVSIFGGANLGAAQALGAPAVGGGLSGLDFGFGGATSPPPPAAAGTQTLMSPVMAPAQPATKPAAQQVASDDLLGLF